MVYLLPLKKEVHTTSLNEWCTFLMEFKNDL